MRKNLSHEQVYSLQGTTGSFIKNRISQRETSDLVTTPPETCTAQTAAFIAAKHRSLKPPYKKVITTQCEDLTKVNQSLKFELLTRVRNSNQVG